MIDCYMGENSIGKFCLPKHDAISDTIAAGEIFDPQVVEVISTYSGRVALDLGANIGQMTVLLSKNFETVYAFEANPELIPILKENLKLNNVNNVIIIEKAVWNESGIQLPFPIPDGRYLSYGSYGVIPNETGARTLESIAIDDLNIENVDFIKSDIQGADLRGMQGATQTILKNKPVILTEYEQNLVSLFNESMEDYKDFAKSVGYKIERQISDNIIIGPDPTIYQ